MDPGTGKCKLLRSLPPTSLVGLGRTRTRARRRDSRSSCCCFRDSGRVSVPSSPPPPPARRFLPFRFLPGNILNRIRVLFVFGKSSRRTDPIFYSQALRGP